MEMFIADIQALTFCLVYRCFGIPVADLPGSVANFIISGWLVGNTSFKVAHSFSPVTAVNRYHLTITYFAVCSNTCSVSSEILCCLLKHL
jgi:hypothetical protein